MSQDMIQGIGIDVVKTLRIENLMKEFGDKFLRHFLTDNEIALIPKKRKTEFIAGRFAAKEAIIKAFGHSEARMRNVEILNDIAGKPYMANEKKILSAMGLESAKLHISISHDRDTTVGFAIIESIT